MNEWKIQTGLRIPEKKYGEISKLAHDSGVSVNAAILMLTELGLQTIRLGTEEQRRSLLHNGQGTDG